MIRARYSKILVLKQFETFFANEIVSAPMLWSIGPLFLSRALDCWKS